MLGQVKSDHLIFFLSSYSDDSIDQFEDDHGHHYSKDDSHHHEKTLNQKLVRVAEE